MKRLRLRLDRGVVRAWGVRHAEKVLFAAVVVCFMAFVYRAVGREGFPRSPQDLLKMTREAEAKIDATKAGSLVVASDYRGQLKRTAGGIDIEFYEHPNLWRPLLHEPPRRRAAPVLLAVRGLRGAAGRGAVHFAPGSANEVLNAVRPAPAGGGSGPSVAGERWIVLTGVVPYREQAEAYREAFRGAAGERTPAPVNFSPMAGAGSAGSSDPDVPRYVYYYVQRVEVGSSDQIARQSDWLAGTIHMGKARQSALRDWGISNGKERDPVAPVYLCPVLDFPLPPLVERPLDATFAHPPEIPIMRPARPPGAGRTENPSYAEDRRPAVGPITDPSDEEDRPPSLPRRDGEVVSPEPAVVPVRLFRFVDRSVEPGRRYRYRARLMLANPNYGWEPRFLQQPDLGRGKHILTDWSNPTDVIQVPRDDRLLVLSVRPSAWIAAEPTASVAVLKWINPLGVEARREEDKAYRGQLLNFAGCTWLPKEPAAAPQGDLQMLLPPGPMAGAEMLGPRRMEPIDVDYLTESLILDMRGGHRIDLRGQGRLPSRESRRNAPGAVLVLDPDGKLVVHNELDEK
jgi:hypothetical protein